MNQEIEQDWLFTWGYGHMFPNKYIIISGTFNSARKKMIEMYGTEWAFQYSINELEELEAVGITELKSSNLIDGR